MHNICVEIFDELRDKTCLMKKKRNAILIATDFQADSKFMNIQAAKN